MTAELIAEHDRLIREYYQQPFHAEHSAKLLQRVVLLEIALTATHNEVSMTRTAQLFASSGEMLIEVPLPVGLAPDVIFYGVKAFQRTYQQKQVHEYRECSCWRAPEKQEKVAKAG